MNQANFVKNCGTIDATWLLIEKYHEKSRPLYIAGRCLILHYTNYCQRNLYEAWTVSLNKSDIIYNISGQPNNEA